MDLQKRTLERLTKKLERLNLELCNTPINKNDLTINSIVDKINQAKEEIFEKKTSQKVTAINKQHAEYRRFAKDFLKITNTYSNEDLINLLTNNGLHKVKVKKFPLLVELINKYKYVYFGVNYNKAFKALYNRKEFYTNNVFDLDLKSEINLTTIEEVCNQLGILPKSKSVKSVLSDIKKVKAETKKFKMLIEKYKEKQKKNNCYFLENNDLIKTISFNSIREYY